jgi:hypothetical protein
MESSFQETGIDNNFLNKTSIMQKLISRINKWDCVELNCFCTENERIYKVKVPYAYNPSYSGGKDQEDYS